MNKNEVLSFFGDRISRYEWIRLDDWLTQRSKIKKFLRTKENNSFSINKSLYFRILKEYVVLDPNSWNSIGIHLTENFDE